MGVPQPVHLVHPRRRHPQFAERQQRDTRSTEYSDSTSIAVYQCFCTAPLSPLRRAIAVCRAAAHRASRRWRSAAIAVATSAAAAAS